MIREALFSLSILSGLQLLCANISGADKQTKAAVLQLSSTAFQMGQAIPAKYTCDGANVSPPLAWSGAPPGTKSFALICEDPDAPKGAFTHRVIYGIPASEKQIAEGVSAGESLPAGAKQGINDFKRAGYGGPCPPPGKPHRYFFKLYALDTDLDLKARPSKKDLLKAMDKHVVGEGELTGTYARSGGKP
jgi:Raf kinase inhibitor-like YbhB/YbcL family protein